MGNCESRQSCEGDAFDGIFKFMSDRNNEPFYIFWDNKSPHMEGGTATDFQQYEHINKIMTEKIYPFYIFILYSSYWGVVV